MARQEIVRSICQPSDASSGDEDGNKFIRCVDRQDPQIHEVLTFVEDGVTREVHPTTRLDFGDAFVGELSTDYLTGSWRRVPMFCMNSINGSVEWLGVPDFLGIDGPAWTDNLMAPHPIWGDRGSSTNPNWGIQYGGGSDIVSVPWNCIVRVLPI